MVSVVVGTCVFFFRKHEKKNNTTESLVAYFNSESNDSFKQKMSNMSSLVNSDGTDSRLNIIIETNENLDSIVNVLISYHIESGTKINDEGIANSFKKVKSSKSTLEAMMNEYIIKATSTYFDRHLGANDFYIKASKYLVQYAEFAKLINNSVDVDKNADVKFNVFDVYSNVVIQTFKFLNTDQSLTSKVVVNNVSNIVIMNNRFTIINSIVQTSTPLFSKNNNDFNKYYNNCNKTEFASRLAENVGTVTSVEQDNNEKIATYYFKMIMGL